MQSAMNPFPADAARERPTSRLRVARNGLTVDTVGYDGAGSDVYCVNEGASYFRLSAAGVLFFLLC
jgi:hypothetical protein